jgi:hypothetical protein
MKNARAQVRREQNVRVQVRPVQNTQAQAQQLKLLPIPMISPGCTDLISPRIPR